VLVCSLINVSFPKVLGHTLYASSSPDRSAIDAVQASCQAGLILSAPSDSDGGKRLLDCAFVVEFGLCGAIISCRRATSYSCPNGGLRATLAFPGTAGY